MAQRSQKKKKQKKEKKEPKEPKVVKSQKMGHLVHSEYDLDWIWIGDAEDARDAVALKQNNVRYILNCTPPRTEGGVMNFHDKDPYFSYCRVAMGDNATETLQKRIEASWDFFERAKIREDGGILVHCQQGVSRSVSMVIAYLMKYYRMGFDECLELAKKARGQACPNDGFTTQLRDLDQLLRSSPPGSVNGYEKIPPKKKMQLSMAAPTVGPARGPTGPARGPAGPARPGVGPAPGPARGPAGPARGPAVGPTAGPQKVEKEKKEKRKAGPAVGPSIGPARP